MKQIRYILIDIDGDVAFLKERVGAKTYTLGFQLFEKDTHRDGSSLPSFYYGYISISFRKNGIEAKPLIVRNQNPK